MGDRVHLIAFSGSLGSGKDAAADRLTALLTIPVVRISFARKLKASAAAVFDIDPAEWEWMKNDPNVLVTLMQWDAEENEPDRVLTTLTARELLQRYGTEAHRDIFGDDFWVNQGLIEFDSYIGPECVFLCTDCRFINEARAIKDRGGTIVRVVGAEQTNDGHVSEAGLPDHFIDSVIQNQIRDDAFTNLDDQLRYVADQLDLPVLAWA